MFDHPSFDRHERVVFAQDGATGLHAIVALHSSARGPAAGGCRFYYNSAHGALGDALPLSRGMSHKNAVAGLPLGGGKAVLMLDVLMLDTHRPKTPAMLEAFGRFIGLRGLTIAVQGLGSAAAESILAEIHRIPARLTEIFARSSATLRPTSELADEMARQLIAEAR